MVTFNTKKIHFQLQCNSGHFKKVTNITKKENNDCRRCCLHNLEKSEKVFQNCIFYLTFASVFIGRDILRTKLKRLFSQ